MQVCAESIKYTFLHWYRVECSPGYSANWRRRSARDTQQARGHVRQPDRQRHHEPYDGCQQIEGWSSCVYCIVFTYFCIFKYLNWHSTTATIALARRYKCWIYFDRLLLNIYTYVFIDCCLVSAKKKPLCLYKNKLLLIIVSLRHHRMNCSELNINININQILGIFVWQLVNCRGVDAALILLACLGVLLWA